jgi:hypothetical protein
MTSSFPFRKFLNLHRMLFARMLLLDLILGVSGSVCLLVPLHIFAFSLNNLSLLVLFVFSAVTYQIHIFRTYAGDATFYLNLPVEKYWLFLMLSTDAMIPVLVSLSITALSLGLFDLIPIDHFNTPMDLSKRAYYLTIILFMLKTTALPVYILFKRHIALLLLFLGSLVVVYELSSIAGALMHLSNMIAGLIFLAGTEVICIRILMSAKIN